MPFKNWLAWLKKFSEKKKLKLPFREKSVRILSALLLLKSEISKEGLEASVIRRRDTSLSSEQELGARLVVKVPLKPGGLNVDKVDFVRQVLERIAKQYNLLPVILHSRICFSDKEGGRQLIIIGLRRKVYPQTIKRAGELIEEFFPGTRAKKFALARNQSEENLAAHALWIIYELETKLMPPHKVGLKMGYLCRILEELEVIFPAELEKLVLEDEEKGYV